MTATERLLPWIAVVNFALVATVLVVLGRLATARPLTELPDGRQNVAEMTLEWFVDLARRIHPGCVRLVAPFLATLFLLILFSNLLALLPIPVLRIPPTAYFSVPLGLALVSVLGVIALKAKVDGTRAAMKHLVWPNPLQLVGEATHTLSLSLRLYGNIGGEHLVAVLAAQAAPWGIPMVIHSLGLVPAVVQPIVFTLLTADFLAAAAVGGGLDTTPHSAAPTRSALAGRAPAAMEVR
jgi:F-type H+-transporting ATPase subunit a